MKKNRFKVGDYIQVIKYPVHAYHSNEMIGRIGKVVSIDHLSFPISIRFASKGTDYLFREDELRKLSKKEIKNLWLYEI